MRVEVRLRSGDTLTMMEDLVVVIDGELAGDEGERRVLEDFTVRWRGAILPVEIPPEARREAEQKMREAHGGGR